MEEKTVYEVWHRNQLGVGEPYLCRTDGSPVSFDEKEEAERMRSAAENHSLGGEEFWVQPNLVWR